jgi:hypothetical protein
MNGGNPFYPSIEWQDKEDLVVGKADIRFPASEAKPLKRPRLPFDEEIIHPPRTVAALKESFRAHSARRIKGLVPSQRELDELLNYSKENYPSFKKPLSYLNTPYLEETVVRKYVKVAMEFVKPTATPGFPYAASDEGVDNRTFLECYAEQVEDLVIKRLIALAQLDCTDQDSQWCVENGLVDPVRMFIKNEGHPKRKVESKTWRLISSVSLVDALVESVLSRELNKAEIKTWWKIPSKPGMGDTDSDRTMLLGTLSAVPSKGWAAADVTGFDWSVQPWELELDAVRRSNMMLLSKDSWARRALVNRAKIFTKMVFCMSDGTLMQPEFPGIQCSGSQNTSSTNSTIRYWIARLVGASKALANGDDCIEEFVEGAEEKYRRLGHPLKFYEKKIDDLEFCSVSFNVQKGTSHAVNMTKSLFNLVDKKDCLEDRILQFKERFRGCGTERLEAALAIVFPERKASKLN